MTIGGWSILNKWLVEAKKTENFPVLVELLEVQLKYSVTCFAVLKKTSLLSSDITCGICLTWFRS